MGHKRQAQGNRGRRGMRMRAEEGRGGTQAVKTGCDDGGGGKVVKGSPSLFPSSPLLAQTRRTDKYRIGAGNTKSVCLRRNLAQALHLHKF